MPTSRWACTRARSPNWRRPTAFWKGVAVIGGSPMTISTRHGAGVEVERDGWSASAWRYGATTSHRIWRVDPEDPARLSPPCRPCPPSAQLSLGVPAHPWLGWHPEAPGYLVVPGYHPALAGRAGPEAPQIRAPPAADPHVERQRRDRQRAPRSTISWYVAGSIPRGSPRRSPSPTMSALGVAAVPKFTPWIMSCRVSTPASSLRRGRA
jgi:hypothetical protein